MRRKPCGLRLGLRAIFEHEHRLNATDHRLYPFWSRCWLCDIPIYIRKYNDNSLAFHYESDEHQQTEQRLLDRNENRLYRLREQEFI